MQYKNGEEPHLADILDFGQAYDDDVLNVFRGICGMMLGFYTLTGMSEQWWDAMNQDVFYSNAVEAEWNRVDWETFQDVIERVYKLTAGTYTRSNHTLDALEQLNKNGKGFTREKVAERKKGEKSENDSK